MNRAQAKAFATGTRAAMDRKKDNQIITYSVECPPSISVPQVTDVLKHALFVRGGLNPATSRLDVVYGQTDIRTMLSETEAALKVEQQRNVRMAAELERLQAQISKQSQADTREWIPLQALAERLGVHYTTVYHAKDKGRLSVKITGGKKNNQYVCDPTSYVPAVRKLSKSKAK